MIFGSGCNFEINIPIFLNVFSMNIHLYIGTYISLSCRTNHHSPDTEKRNRYECCNQGQLRNRLNPQEIVPSPSLENPLIYKDRLSRRQTRLVEQQRESKTHSIPVCVGKRADERTPLRSLAEAQFVWVICGTLFRIISIHSSIYKLVVKYGLQGCQSVHIYVYFVIMYKCLPILVSLIYIFLLLFFFWKASRI